MKRQQQLLIACLASIACAGPDPQGTELSRPDALTVEVAAPQESASAAMDTLPLAPLAPQADASQTPSPAAPVKSAQTAPLPPAPVNSSRIPPPAAPVKSSQAETSKTGAPPAAPVHSAQTPPPAAPVHSAQTPPPAASAADSELPRGGVRTLVDPGDPGPPYYGPKCSTKIDGRYVLHPSCIHVLRNFEDGLMHLFLNFCFVMEENGAFDRCARDNETPAYVSLVFEIPAYEVAHVVTAIGGRIHQPMADGREYEALVKPGEPIALEYEIYRRAHPTYPEGVLTSRLSVQLPPKNGTGEPLLLELEF